MGVFDAVAIPEANPKSFVIKSVENPPAYSLLAGAVGTVGKTAFWYNRKW